MWERLEYSLGFEFVELIDLFTHFGNGVVVLLPEVGEGGLVLDVGFLEVPPEFAHLGFALLVELDLGGGGTTGLFQPLAQFFEFPGQVGSLFLGLRILSRSVSKSTIKRRAK